MIKRGLKWHNPHIRKQQRQAKSNRLTTRVQNPIKIGLKDPIVNTKKNIKKAKVTGQTDNIDENDVRIY